MLCRYKQSLLTLNLYKQTPVCLFEQELEDVISRMRSDKVEADEKSLFVFEENEEHLKKLHECEAVSCKQ